MVYEYVVLQLSTFVVPATLLAILALALNLQWGQTGLFNAGVAGFAGVGAYFFGMLVTGSFAIPDLYWFHWGPSEPWGIVAAAFGAMVFAGVLGAVVAVPTLRLRADYLAIATLALAEIVRLILKNERALTGGDQTLAFIPRPLDGLVPRGWAAEGVFMLFAVGLMLGLLLLMEFLTRSPWGRALKAVREDEEAATALGKNAFVLKIGAFSTGCAFMGMYGALLASFQGVIVPDQFAPFTTFIAYVVVILGGSGNPRGVILGAYVFSLFGWTTQQLRAYLPEAFALRIDFVNQIVIGVLLVVVILWRPDGIMPEPRFVPRTASAWRRLRLRPPPIPFQWFGLAVAWFAFSGVGATLLAVEIHSRAAFGIEAFGAQAHPAVLGIAFVVALVAAITALGFTFEQGWVRRFGPAVALVDVAVMLVLLLQPSDPTASDFALLRLFAALGVLYVFVRAGVLRVRVPWARSRGFAPGGGP